MTKFTPIKDLKVGDRVILDVEEGTGWPSHMQGAPAVVRAIRGCLGLVRLDQTTQDRTIDNDRYRVLRLEDQPLIPERLPFTPIKDLKVDDYVVLVGNWSQCNLGKEGTIIVHHDGKVGVKIGNEEFAIGDTCCQVRRISSSVQQVESVSEFKVGDQVFLRQDRRSPGIVIGVYKDKKLIHVRWGQNCTSRHQVDDLVSLLSEKVEPVPVLKTKFNIGDFVCHARIPRKFGEIKSVLANDYYQVRWDNGDRASYASSDLEPYLLEQSVPKPLQTVKFKIGDYVCHHLDDSSMTGVVKDLEENLVGVKWNSTSGNFYSRHLGFNLRLLEDKVNTSMPKYSPSVFMMTSNVKTIRGGVDVPTLLEAAEEVAYREATSWVKHNYREWPEGKKLVHQLAVADGLATFFFYWEAE